MEMTEPLLALLAAIFGGVGLKVIESLLDRSTRKADLARQIRDELRAEVTSLREQLNDIQGRIDSWRRQYYDLLVAFNELMAIAMSEGLTDEVDAIRQRLAKYTDHDES